MSLVVLIRSLWYCILAYKPEKSACWIQNFIQSNGYRLCWLVRRFLSSFRNTWVMPLYRLCWGDTKAPLGSRTMEYLTIIKQPHGDGILPGQRTFWGHQTRNFIFNAVQNLYCNKKNIKVVEMNEYWQKLTDFIIRFLTNRFTNDCTKMRWYHFYNHIKGYWDIIYTLNLEFRKSDLAIYEVWLFVT